jgi:hypothetical protein
MGPVAAPIGDAPQLFDIQVDQLAGSGALIAADHPAGGPVHGGQPTQAMADQDAMDGGGGPAGRGGDPGRAELVGAAQPQDCGLLGGRDPAGVMVGGAGPVDQAGLAVLLVAGPPAGGVREMPISAATWAAGRPAAMRWHKISLPAGVRRALA